MDNRNINEHTVYVKQVLRGAKAAQRDRCLPKKLTLMAVRAFIYTTSDNETLFTKNAKGP